MKKLYLFITVASITLSRDVYIQAKDKTPQSTPSAQVQQPVGTNPYIYAPMLFTAENSSTGYFWQGDGTKKYPGKAFLGEIEYSKVIAIEKEQTNTKLGKKLRKNKQYLGSYVDAQSGKVFCVYGIKKTPDKVDDAPDADVLTQIAIKEDYGPGE